MADTSNVAISHIKINDVDFFSAFDSCTIFEDITRNSWSGHVDIIDNDDFRESIPIIGEEKISIRFASKQPVSGNTDEWITFDGVITKLSNFREASSTQRRYRLHFYSQGAEKNRTKRVRKVYDGTGTEIANRILQKQLETSLGKVDPAKYSQRFVFPNWTPFQCINYLASVSVSKQYNDPAYLFYEDRNGYHMTTLSKLMDKGFSETINTKIIQNRTDPISDTVLASVTLHDPLFDIIENTDAGMYGTTLITYDKVYKRFKEETKTYTDSYYDFKHLGTEKLTRKRIESPKNKFQFIMINDAKSPGVYSNTDDWAMQSMIRPSQIFGFRAHISLNRSTDIRLGDVLDWNLLVSRDSEERDKILAGKWMVARIRHQFNNINYNPNIEFIKDSIK